MATVNLNKTPKINLRKGQVINLTKDGTNTTPKLTKIFFGARWGQIGCGVKRVVTERKYTGNFIQRLFKFGPFEIVQKETIVGKNSFVAESVDLDASVLMYDGRKNLFDTVYYGHLRSNCGSIYHSGDDVHGSEEEVDRDNEVITMQLDKVPSQVKYLVVILNSFRHHKFDKIPFMKLRIHDGKEVLCAYNVENNPDFEGKEAIILGQFFRDPNGNFQFKADGTTTSEESIREIANGSAKTVLV